MNRINSSEQLATPNSCDVRAHVWYSQPTCYVDNPLIIVCLFQTCYSTIVWAVVSHALFFASGRSMCVTSNVWPYFWLTVIYHIWHVKRTSCMLHVKCLTQCDLSSKIYPHVSC